MFVTNYWVSNYYDHVSVSPSREDKHTLTTLPPFKGNMSKPFETHFLVTGSYKPHLKYDFPYIGRHILQQAPNFHKQGTYKLKSKHDFLTMGSRI